MKAEMVSILFAAVLPFQAVHFGLQPLQKEVGKGISVYRMGGGLDRVLQDSKRVLTTRTVHFRVEELEQVIWLSPALVSRWLGYLWALEKWPDGELERRWGALRGALDGRLTFVVQLAKYPSGERTPDPLAMLELGGPFSGAEFLFTAGGSELPLAPGPSGAFGLSREPKGGNLAPWDATVFRREMRSGALAEIVSRDPIRTSDVAWIGYSPFGQLLSPVAGEELPMPLAPLGDYAKAWFLVQTPVPESIYVLGDMQVRVLGLGREKVAGYRLIG